MELFWWLVVIVLFAVGLLGTVLPMIPGPVIILGAAVLHRIMLGPEKSAGWITIGILALLALMAYALDFVAASFGAKRFGATRWGVLGAFAGALVGIFFGIVGLLVGPIIGALSFEFLAARQLVKAGRAAWGTLLGNLGGMVAKLALALIMISIFLVRVPTPF